jgi:hypothetical protein
MVTHYLVQARDCMVLDPQRISDAGGQLVSIGRLEDDGTVIVDVDIDAEDREANLRLSQIFSEHH